jgi:hypothetical protein
MRFPARPLALIAVCGIALVCTACSSNSKKIVGKWKMVSVTGKDGKEQMAEPGGIGFIMEFTSDGNVKVGLDTSTMPEEMKKLMEKNKEAGEKMNEMKQVGKYKVSGSTIEFLDMQGSGDNPFGKKQGGKLSFSGNDLTITSEDATVKLTRMK